MVSREAQASAKGTTLLVSPNWKNAKDSGKVGQVTEYLNGLCPWAQAEVSVPLDAIKHEIMPTTAISTLNNTNVEIL
jgi:hypothetical protein